MMNKSITQPITQACLFSSYAYFQTMLIFKYQFWEVLILFSSHAYFQVYAYFRENMVIKNELTLS